MWLRIKPTGRLLWTQLHKRQGISWVAKRPNWRRIVLHGLSQINSLRKIKISSWDENCALLWDNSYKSLLLYVKQFKQKKKIFRWHWYLGWGYSTLDYAEYWFSKGFWQWSIHYTNIMSTVHTFLELDPCPSSGERGEWSFSVGPVKWR
jgi:hypothetical protein